ncbi:patched domain-containing protein 3-like isoform X2 [Xenia sp. Carnegie-2017]|uniref:patched domain-containing protein 3-like isoform X2 n=1 Tax=Xenia sp. Carnegie-2017 TaxID=2897299 RepID=UPI001F03C6A4|nr:patched domain-containing protein 3-like isoform X2 [Xenia sp. Carnegie-2017]
MPTKWNQISVMTLICCARLGKLVGSKPWLVIFATLLISSLCLLGLLNFQREGRIEKMWVPERSQALQDKVWVEARFPEKFHSSLFIFYQDNVLDVQSIRKMLEIHERIVNMKIMFDGKSLSWNDLCFRVGGQCAIHGILELWLFNKTIIESLKKDKILSDIGKRPTFSPYSGRVFSLERTVGGITYEDGNISGARAFKVSYALKSNLQLDKSSGEEIDRRARLWEKEFAKILDEYDNIVYYTNTEFHSTSQNSIKSDIKLLSTGYALLIFYVAFVIGKLNRLEVKMWLATVGVIGVAMSIGVSIGLCSAIGLLFGTAHLTLPFLLLGIGVDDLFVIVQSWSNISPAVHRHNTIEERIGLALKHSGTSITVTTVTDVLAFLVGGTTILPGLKSFCLYAAVGILSGYIFQLTFFVGWLTIDARRQSANRDGCLSCLVLPENYTPNKFFNLQFTQIFFEKIYSKILLKVPVKVIVLISVAVFLAISVRGSLLLRQHFEPKWILPRDSVIRRYIEIDSREFPFNGHPIAIYLGPMDYYAEQMRLHRLYEKLQNDTERLSSNSLESWYESYVMWMKKHHPEYVYFNNSTINNEKAFYFNLKIFLDGSEGRKFASHVKWNKSGNRIEASRFSALQPNFADSVKEVQAMDSLRELVKNVSPGARVYGFSYLWAESYKVIGTELYRNILLAMLVVFIVTFFIIANPMTSFLVFLCVAFTVVDVAGLMYYWNLTIDVVSAIVLVIGVGLSVDYASHVGHAYLMQTGNSKERATKALQYIGPAVWNGGFSTFLAIVLLPSSESYIFMTFFKVLSGVVIFGLFHGLVFLPIILSILNPSPYKSALKITSSFGETGTGLRHVAKVTILQVKPNGIPLA